MCEIVTFCVRTHAYRMRYYIILNNLASKILKLTHAPEKYLRLGEAGRTALQGILDGRMTYSVLVLTPCSYCCIC